MFEFTEKDGALIIAVRVVPRASKSEIVGTAVGALKIRIAPRRLTARRTPN